MYVLSVFIGHVLIMVLKMSDKNRIAYLKLPEKMRLYMQQIIIFGRVRVVMVFPRDHISYG